VTTNEWGGSEETSLELEDVREKVQRGGQPAILTIWEEQYYVAICLHLALQRSEWEVAESGLTSGYCLQKDRELIGA